MQVTQIKEVIPAHAGVIQDNRRGQLVSPRNSRTRGGDPLHLRVTAPAEM